MKSHGMGNVIYLAYMTSAIGAIISPFFLGMSLLAAGSVDRAFEEFRKGQQERSPWMVWWGTEPKLKTMHDDERYWKILEATNNPIIDLIRK